MNNAAGKIHCPRSRPNLSPKYTEESAARSYPRASRTIERNSRRQSRKWPCNADSLRAVAIEAAAWMGGTRNYNPPKVRVVASVELRIDHRSSPEQHLRRRLIAEIARGNCVNSSLERFGEFIF